MIEVGVHEAKTNLSELLRRISADEGVVIARRGEPIADIVPVAPPARRILGQDAGIYEVPDDFDGPLPDDVLDRFEA